MRRGNSWAKYFWLAIVLYMMYTVGRLAWKNHQLNLEEMKLRQDVAVLENEIQDLKNKIVYYQSDSYKEKMIRAKLNMQKEGEKVVVITPEAKVEEIPEKERRKLSNPDKWWVYFFGE